MESNKPYNKISSNENANKDSIWSGVAIGAGSIGGLQLAAWGATDAYASNSHVDKIKETLDELTTDKANYNRDVYDKKRGKEHKKLENIFHLRKGKRIAGGNRGFGIITGASALLGGIAGGAIDAIHKE